MPKFTKQESQEMYDILIEIQDALTDKSDNTGGILKLSQDEIDWLMRIDDLLKKIHDQIT